MQFRSVTACSLLWIPRVNLESQFISMCTVSIFKWEWWLFSNSAVYMRWPNLSQGKLFITGLQIASYKTPTHLDTVDIASFAVSAA